MENPGSVMNGALRLTPRSKFMHTDEELVRDYLTKKVLSHPLPDSIIMEANVYKSDPWDLPGGEEKERYFFSTREVKGKNGSNYKRQTGTGFWKISGLEKRITNSRSNQVIGFKKTLVFYRGKAPKSSKTDWIMHEYRVITPPTTIDSPPTENQVLCKIFLKKKSKKNEETMHVNGEGSTNQGPMVRARLNLNESPASSSSASD